MSIREEIVNGLIQADDDRIAAHVMDPGPAREDAWRVAMDTYKSLQQRATSEELAAATAASRHRDGERR